MRVSLAFLVQLFSFWTWKAFFLHWVCWSPPSPSTSGETTKEEQLPLSQEGQQESELSHFLSSLPGGKCRCTGVRFKRDSRVELYFRSRPDKFDEVSLNTSPSEFFATIASSKVLFHEGLHVYWVGEESCKHMEAFGDVLCQFALKKLHISFHRDSTIQFAKHVSSVVLGNVVIEDLILQFTGLSGLIGKAWVAEFTDFITLPSNLRILKSLEVFWEDMDGEAMEQLVKPFKSPHSGLECFHPGILTSDVQFEHISDMLATNTSLTTLHIFPTSSKVFQSGYTSLAVALFSNQSLKTLGCEVHSSMELKALLNPLLPRKNNVQCNTTLTKLGLWGNIGGKEGIETLVHMLCTNSSLLKLDLFRLDDLCVDDFQGIENVLAILEALKANTSLKRIGFGYCSAIGGYKVLGAMMDLLLDNHCIEDIDLHHTPMEESGDAEYVYLALSKRKEMKLWDIVQGMANVSPTFGRVFLCGEPYAGK